MDLGRRCLRFVFDRIELVLGWVFPPASNPLLNLGALGFLFYWVITISGIYLYIFFDTGVSQAYDSVEYMTHEQWYAAGVMRSLHRYASDGLVVVMLLHIAREFSLDRYRGVRWFSWITGVPILVLIFAAGITGYWLVWDRLAQYVAIVTTEWLDRLPIFGEPIARNFLSPDSLDSRFFTLMVFMHIAVPLIGLIVLWVHLQRVTKPRINPSRGLAAFTLASMLVLSLVHPAISQGAADLAQVPGTLGLDWFYLPLYPLLENWPGIASWGAAVACLVAFCAIPFLPPLRKPPTAVVNLSDCNGCMRCFRDCPYSAIAMRVRSDGRPFEREAVVDPRHCVSCGICVGACPTAMPFRRASDLVAGIELPDRLIAGLRAEVEDKCAEMSGPGRIIVFGCEHGVSFRALPETAVASIKLRCIGQLPPSFIDFVLSKRLADGVVLTGCSDNSCHARFGIRWTDARVARQRDPQLRARVPRERLRVLWAGRAGGRQLDKLLASFSEALRTMPSEKAPHFGTSKGQKGGELVDG